MCAAEPALATLLQCRSPLMSHNTLTTLPGAMRRRSEFISDRPSSRVLAAPGGAQSFNIFGGAEPAPAPQRRAAPTQPTQGTYGISVAAGARMPVRTEHTGISEHPSTLVHAPPGGRQSFNIFGGEGYSQPTPAPAAAPTQGTYGVSVAAGARMPVRTEHTGISEHPSTLVHAPPGGRQSFNIFGGEGYSEPTPAPAAAPVTSAPGVMAAGQRVIQRTEFHGIQDRNSTLVHAAPGGESSMASMLGGSTAADRIAAMKARRDATAIPLAEATNSTRPW